MEELVELAIVLFMLLLFFSFHVLGSVLHLLIAVLLRFLIAEEVQLIQATHIVRETSIGLASFVKLDARPELHHFVGLRVERLHDLTVVVLAQGASNRDGLGVVHALTPRFGLACRLQLLLFQFPSSFKLLYGKCPVLVLISLFDLVTHFLLAS